MVAGPSLEVQPFLLREQVVQRALVVPPRLHYLYNVDLLVQFFSSHLQCNLFARALAAMTAFWQQAQHPVETERQAIVLDEG